MNRDVKDRISLFLQIYSTNRAGTDRERKGEGEEEERERRKERIGSEEAGLRKLKGLQTDFALLRD